MQLKIGEIVEGKVSGITKFGAFVDLGENTSGMVHISEVARTYVNDINEHVKLNDTVKVKVLNIGEDGKISLSIKRALDPEPRTDREQTFQNRVTLLAFLRASPNRLLLKKCFPVLNKPAMTNFPI